MIADQTYLGKRDCPSSTLCKQPCTKRQRCLRQRKRCLCEWIRTQLQQAYLDGVERQIDEENISETQQLGTYVAFHGSLETLLDSRKTAITDLSRLGMPTKVLSIVLQFVDLDTDEELVRAAIDTKMCNGLLSFAKYFKVHVWYLPCDWTGGIQVDVMPVPNVQHVQDAIKGDLGRLLIESKGAQQVLAEYGEHVCRWGCAGGIHCAQCCPAP